MSPGLALWAADRAMRFFRRHTAKILCYRLLPYDAADGEKLVHTLELWLAFPTPSTQDQKDFLPGQYTRVFNTWSACPWIHGSIRRGGLSPPPNPPCTRSLTFKIIFQDFGKIILKNNLEKKSRLFFKILAKIFLNKIIDFTIYLYVGAKRPL